MPKTLLVEGAKTFKITVADESRITFGPWSPGSSADKYSNSDRALSGTLRIYEKGEKSPILAVFSGVKSFRELNLDYEEQVAREEGAILWKSDKDGYKREEKVRRSTDWIDPLNQLEAGEEDE